MKNYVRLPDPAPRRLVKNGTYQLGTFNEGIQHVNLLDAKKPLGLSLPKQINNLRLREWQAFQIANDDHFFMVAIFDAKPMGLVHFVHYDIKANKKRRYEKQVPSPLLNVASGLEDSRSHYNSKSFSIEVINRTKEGFIKVSLKIKGDNENPPVSAEFLGQHEQDLMTPIVVCQPFDKNKVMYSHKGLMPLKGSVSLGLENIMLKKKNSWMIIDDHKGYYPRRTQWDWVTGAINKKGKRIGFNLTDNQVINKEQYNENCLWVNEELHLLPAVKFERKNGLDASWIIKDKYGRVDVKYTSSTRTTLYQNYIVARTDYYSSYGYFEGFIKNSSGKKVSINGLFGAGEKFDITM